MPYVKNNESMIGKKVILTEGKNSVSGYFERGDEVVIVDKNERGYSFQDEYGNSVIEAGFGGFIEMKTE